jgi:hypothetical protein
MNPSRTEDRKPRVEKQKLLIVEGKDEVALFHALLGYLQRDDVQVMDVGGKTKIRVYLAGLVLDPLFPSVDALAVVRDADHPMASAAPGASAASDAWKSACAAIEHARLPVPARHGVLSLGRPRTAIYIFPDGESDGMLEDLCLKAFTSDVAYPCMERYFECLASAGVELRREVRAKARLHAFLASRKDPDVRLGEAARKGYLPCDAPAFSPLIALLREL